ncbi:DHHC zinc finger protein (macronuclear) [Tetrahymena thermophila SB210]|uniref:DHHC zinc finger protein n=1 Tax=Tetrahymena thermophila (strain SB210) TaxID=312017 RepID=Q241A1_TETTS|nr:DHHC zinc finger protein [Tetrahymena thermophila SB210]EAS02263.1 DHHC zinc finger protein [Tetrahymena thermophila SB210]|eukprot:XP_001022508.1 DHHC zinc finger protein [Tetrahymena thermophila SB210]
MIKQTGINSTDSMNEPQNPQDAFPLVYSGSSGQLNIQNENFTKKEQEQVDVAGNYQSPTENNKLTQEKKNQFGFHSSNSLKSQVGTDKKRLGSRNTLTNKQFDQDNTNSMNQNIQFSMEQQEFIKINQSDSLALSDLNQGLLSSQNNLFQKNVSQQDLEIQSMNQIAEQAEENRSFTEINIEKGTGSFNQSKQIQNRSKTHQSSHQNSSSSYSSKPNLNAREIQDLNYTQDQNNLQFQRRDPDFGGSEPLIQRNLSGLNTKQMINSNIASANKNQAVAQRHHTTNTFAAEQNQSCYHESQKQESDQESSDSHYQGESLSSYGPFKLLQKGYLKELKDHCKKEGILYTRVINEQGNNMIIKAVQNKDLEAIKQLISDAREQLREIGKSKEQIDEEISQWINQESKSGYTAAHFSCYVGDPSILKLLKEQGADFLKLNKEESSGLHVAAQNDSIASIVFLLLLGIDINVQDQKEATPLHWASFQGLDQSVQFLIAFGSKTNIQDSEGMTPLILSSISGSMKIVRMLLLAGADRNIQDKKGRTALYMVTEDQENLNEDIAEMLKRTNGFQEYWNIRPVFKPTKKNPKQVIYYLIMYILSQICLIYFNYSLWEQNTKIIIFSILALLAIITKFFFLNSWLRNPGYVALNKKKNTKSKSEEYTYLEKMSKESFQRKQYLSQSQQKIYSSKPLDEITRNNLIELFLLLQKEQESQQICAHCCILKPKRSRHCDICKNCVSVYDHHCPWINNCVGTNNHGYFLGYIISIWLSIIAFTILNAIYIWQFNYPQQNSSVSPVYIDPLNLFTQDQHILFFVLKVVLNSIAVFFCLLFGIPLTLLLFVQLGNFRANKTTYERFSQQAKINQLSQVTESNGLSALAPADDTQLHQSLLNDTQTQYQQLSSFQNCLQMCFYNKKNPNYRFRNISERNISQP